jgi:glutamate---cysteine ligase / carboxylate-amine ligase
VGESRSQRKIGVEEELMLVDPDTGRLRAVSHRAMAAHREQSTHDDSGFGAEAGLEQELFLQQIETGTTPCHDVGELLEDLRRCRHAAAESARAVGVDVVAVATPVLGGQDREVTPKPRYQRIVGNFGEISRQGSVCGMHLHIDVVDDREAVRVVDELRPWLPVLRAMSVNSPYWYGQDTGYASWRTQIWDRWPSAGPSEPFGDVAGFRKATDALIAAGASLDRGMLYLDARPSNHYPTVEVRVFDVVTEVDDIGLIASLTRALVDKVATSSDQEPWRTDLLRAAHWRASRHGLSSDLVDPLTGALAPARTVLERMIDSCQDALVANDDLERVHRSLERLLAQGTGATRQRAVAERVDPDDLPRAVIADLRERFAASCQG